MLLESRNLLMEQVSSETVMPFARRIKQKVRRHYPRPCTVSVTLLWACNLLYDVNLDGGRGSEVYCVCCLFSFIVFSLWSRTACEAARTHFAKLDKSV
jgi:hypothetical protein